MDNLIISYECSALKNQVLMCGIYSANSGRLIISNRVQFIPCPFFRSLGICLILSFLIASIQYKRIRFLFTIYWVAQWWLNSFHKCLLDLYTDTSGKIHHTYSAKNNTNVQSKPRAYQLLVWWQINWLLQIPLTAYNRNGLNNLKTTCQDRKMIMNKQTKTNTKIWHHLFWEQMTSPNMISYNNLFRVLPGERVKPTIA